ncbi:LysR family transcriptional regulator [Nocardioides dubius]|uniref:LysR family transcriptional regulator n=1 Tax=Nocardioides dubius TaxID=317019 RepID=A0ABP4E7Q1_9ACTN
MRIQQLEYIEAITRFGSLRRASEHLHISQPALSESISRLERELGVALLDRHRTGARISRRGRELLTHMNDATEAVRRLRAAASEEFVATRNVHIGTVQAANATLLTPALRAYRARFPEVNVEIRNMQQTEIFHELSVGALDLGLVNVLEGDDPPSDIDRIDLIHGEPVAVLPHDHPLAEHPRLSPAQVGSAPFIAMRPGYLMHRFAHRWFDGRLPRSVYTADGAELGTSLVAEGLGLTLLPDFTVVGHPLARAGAITYRPLDGDPPTVTLIACQRQGVRPPEPVRDLISALLRKARDYTGAS